MHYVTRSSSNLYVSINVYACVCVCVCVCIRVCGKSVCRRVCRRVCKSVCKGARRRRSHHDPLINTSIDRFPVCVRVCVCVDPIHYTLARTTHAYTPCVVSLYACVTLRYHMYSSASLSASIGMPISLSPTLYLRISISVYFPRISSSIVRQ